MARTKVALATHKALLVNGDTIEYQGAHPTHWTFGGVDADGKPDGSPVETVRVLAYMPGTVPDLDPYSDEDDPRDAEILKLRAVIDNLKAQLGDKKDADLEQLRKAVDSLMAGKAAGNKVELTPEEIRANEDAATEYKPGGGS